MWSAMSLSTFFFVLLHFLILLPFDLSRFFLAADGWTWGLIFALSDFIIGSGFFSCAHVHAVLFQFPCFLIFFFFFSLGNCTSWFPFVVQGTNLNEAFLCTNWPTLKNLGLKGNPLIVALNWGYQFLVTTQVTVLAYFSRNCAFGFSKLKKLRIDVS